MIEAAAPWVTAVHITLIAVSACATLLSIAGAVKSVSKKKGGEDSLYADRDGSASDESQQAYFSTIKRLLVALSLLSIAGLAVSIVYGIKESSEPQQKYRNTASGIFDSWSPLTIWVCLLRASLPNLKANGRVVPNMRPDCLSRQYEGTFDQVSKRFVADTFEPSPSSNLYHRACPNSWHE